MVSCRPSYLRCTILPNEDPTGALMTSNCKRYMLRMARSNQVFFLYGKENPSLHVNSIVANHRFWMVYWMVYTCLYHPFLVNLRKIDNGLL